MSEVTRIPLGLVRGACRQLEEVGAATQGSQAGVIGSAGAGWHIEAQGKLLLSYLHEAAVDGEP